MRTLDNRAHVFSFTPEDRDYKIKLQEKGIENSDGLSYLAVEYTLPQKLIDFVRVASIENHPECFIKRFCTMPEN